MIICFALIGNLPITLLRMMSLHEFSTVHSCPLVTMSTLATPPTQPSPILVADSACPTPSSAARVDLRVQLPGGSATGGAWLGAGAASSPPAPGPPTGRMRAPRAPSSPWRRRRRSAMPSVWTSPRPVEQLHAKTASITTFHLPVSSLVVLAAGIVEDPYWRSGGSVPHLTSAQLP